jgi:hypothetical protein
VNVPGEIVAGADFAVGGSVVDADWQRLWFGTLNNPATPWTSLTVAGSGGPADLTAVADRIVAMARTHGGLQATVLDATGVEPADVAGLIARLTALNREGTRTVVAAASPAAHPAILPLIRATSGVLLVVRLGESTLQATREIADAIDRSKIIGSIVIG